MKMDETRAADGRQDEAALDRGEGRWTVSRVDHGAAGWDIAEVEG